MENDTFSVNDEVNTHNSRFWIDTNPHWFRETHTKKSQKLNVGARILGDHIVGPTYLELLENTIDSMITQIVEKDDNLIHDQIMFQHDGRCTATLCC